MKKLTRALFAVADVALAAMLLGIVFALMRVFFAFLDLSIPGGAEEGRVATDYVLAALGLPSMTALSLVLLVVALFFTLAYALSYFLLLQKQVVGLFIMFSLDLLGFLLWPFDPVLAAFVGVRMLILGAPWLLTWIDLKRRGTLA